ncbi:MAG: BON domain-containing protein [Blastocatellia bacterium]
MKKTIALTFTLLLTIAVASTQTSLASQEGDMLPKKKSEKPAKAAAATPKTDAEIQKCISDKFAASKTITNGAATVANGEATLTGEAKSGGAKGGATRQAKACGAKKVVNNMTTPKPAPKAAPAAAKAGDKADD